MGWVSLVSGERKAAGAPGDAEAEGARVVAAAATTFLASLVGVPLSARALTLGRKFAIIATSLCFVVSVEAFDIFLAVLVDVLGKNR